MRKVPLSEWITNDNEKLRIISEELWAAVRAQNQSKNQKTSSATNGGMNRTAASRTYLLSGCLQCGLCKASMAITGGTAPNSYYRCPYHRFRGSRKNNLKIRQRRLEDQLRKACGLSADSRICGPDWRGV
jgi:site-specific DNA recombinase